MTVDVKLTMPNSAKLMVEAIRVIKSSDNIDRFLKFAQMWYEDSKKNLAADIGGYAHEWMERFNKGWEYLDADNTRKGYLLSIDGKENGIQRWAKELANYNGITVAEALPEVKKKVQDIKISLKGRKTRAPVKKHKKCICKSAGIMIGKMPKIEGKNFL